MNNTVFQWTVLEFAPLCNEQQIGAAVLSMRCSGSQKFGCFVMSAMQVSWISLLIKH